MRTHFGGKALLGALCLLFTGFLIIRGAPKPAPKNVDYPYYGGDPGATRYSTLTQINAKNAPQLKEVWRYDLGGPSNIENQPIVVNGILYGVGADSIYALDAATGKQQWVFEPLPASGRIPRGETFWTDGKEHRLIVARGNIMLELNADTGKLIPGFADEGQLDLNGQLRGPASANRVGMNSPAGIYKDILITHGGVGETTPASPGDLRGWDVRTGKLLWTFHTIPYPGEEGYDTWPKDAYQKAGGANAWGGVAMDEKRGIVFATTGSGADDFYGGDRLGNNLYANSIIAIDAANDLTTRTPEAHAAVLEHFKTMLSGPMFTPPAFEKETIVAPGFAGGVEWGGLMTDPVNHVAFFNSERIAWYTSVMPRHPPAKGPERDPHSRYSTQGYRSFRDPDGYPATAPPWGTLTAVDLNTGKFLWNVPFGEYPELEAAGVKGWGSENYGAGVVTASGIMMIASAVADSHFKVYDTKTGKVISSTPLPFPGIASPATYMVNGRQYVVFATSTGRARKLKEQGSMLVAYALPQ